MVMIKLTLIEGDALKVLPTLPGESVDLIIADPPFFVLKQDPNLESAEWDYFKDLNEFLEFTKKWLRECYRVLKNNSQMYVFWSQKWQKEFWNLDQPFEIKRMLIWDNPCKTKGFTSKMYLWNYTPIFFLSKGDIVKFNASFTKKENVDVFRFPAPQPNFKKDKQFHPCQKPYELIKILIKNSSNEGDTVLDPFLGSGTTMKACLELKRNCIGIEINPKYVEITKKRLNWGSSLGNVIFEFKKV